jgi:hypothetical protein
MERSDQPVCEQTTDSVGVEVIAELCAVGVKAQKREGPGSRVCEFFDGGKGGLK